MKLWLSSQPTRLAPMDFQRAVANFARDNGGQTAEIVWVGHEVNAWQVKLYLKPNDPRRRGDDPNTHFEPVMLTEWVDPQAEPDHPKLDRLRRNQWGRLMPGYISYELEELGVEGLLDILRKGSLLSGRGEYASAEHALKASLAREEERSRKSKEAAKDQAKTRFKERRRKIMGIPFLPVGIDLRDNKEKTT